MSTSRSSTALTYEQLDTSVRSGRVAPLYFFFGEEMYLMEEAQRLLSATVLQDHERDFNYDLVYGPEAEGAPVLALCNAYPMMAERRLVIVRDFEKLKSNVLFTAYAERPNPHAVVVLVCRTKPNLTQHPYRALKDKATTVEFKAYKVPEAVRWVVQACAQSGIKMTPEAASLLVELSGTDLQILAAEVEKLTTRAERTRVIGREDVLAAGGHSREFNVFELQNAIGQRNFKEALRITEALLTHASHAAGEALKILGLVTSYFTKLLKLHYGLALKVPQAQLARDTGIPPYFVKDYEQQLRRFSEAQLHTSLSVLLAADYELKGGSSRSPHVIMTLVIRKLLLS